MAKAKKDEEKKKKKKAKAEKAEKPNKKDKKAKNRESEEESEDEAEAESEEPKGKKKRGKLVEEANDEAPTASYGKGLTVPAAIPGFEVDDVLDSIERRIGVGSTGLGGDNEARMSTGNLVLDIILGGGLTAGWYTNFGKEQSCKSTGAMTIVASAVAQGVPICAFYDYEGSSEPTYLQNLMNTMGVNAKVADIFGVRDRKGNYVKKPRVRYVPSATAETFFDYLADLERKLPDKIYEGGQWWYVYDHTKENRKRLGDVAYDKKMFSKHNKFYVPAEDGSLQAILVVDSYPAMLPERLDEEEASSGLGAVARMFSEQLPRVKGKLRKKRIAVLGVNQLRDAPMVRYGSPEYEPGGNAIKFNSDARIKFQARALSAAGDAKASEGTPFELEQSVEFEGKDTYRYISVKAEKNKLSTPYLSGFIRLWITDGEGHARGFDPVYDTMAYLRMTGQVKEGGKRKKILLQFKGNEARKTIEWIDFKTLVLGSKEDIAKVCKQAGMKPMMLRKLCFKQMRSKVGIDLYFEKQNSKSKDKDEDEDGGDDE